MLLSINDILGHKPLRTCLQAVLFSATLAFLGSCGGGSSGGGGGGGGGNPPAAPTGLTATAGNAQVGLAWNSVTTASSYNVKRSTTSGGPYTTLSSATVTNYTDATAVNGTTYYYVVSAVNANGESANSGEASAKPVAPVGAPQPPTGLNAVPGNAQVTLSWTASSGATSYNIKRGSQHGGPYSTIASPAGTVASDTSTANSTTYYYVVTAVNANGESGNSSEVSATPLSTITNLSLTIDVYTNRHTISPYVYGAAFPKDANTIEDSGLTVVRWGGNGASTYNWQLGTSNADNDYYFEDFAFNALNNPADSDSRQFIMDVQSAGSNPLMTMVMLPWVAQSAETSTTQGGTDNYHWSFSVIKDGACSTKVDQFNTDAGVNLQADCTTPMVASFTQLNRTYYPLLDDHTQTCLVGTCEYRSDWAAALASAFNSPNPAPTCSIPYSTITSCHFYDMDNEIDIWGSTHVDVHPNPTTYDELANIYLTEAAKLKTWDPQAVRMGWVSCCWSFYWNSAAGSTDKANHANIDFMPWWLNEVAWQDQVNGARTLDILDLHAYPETTIAKPLTTQARALVLRSTRDWWDANYTSEAWFGSVNGVTAQEPLDHKAFRIPRARAWANTIYPETPLAFTEWNFDLGNESDFSTALADADAYGILGRERVALSTRWTAPDPANPNYLALKLYTNYDGAHHGFAPLSVSATNTGDPNLFSCYAATSIDGTTITLMVINKDPANTASVNLNLNLLYAPPGSIATYTLAASNPTMITQATPAMTPVMNFPPYSATMLVMTFPPGHVNYPTSEWDLNPDTIVIPTGGSATLAPRLTSGTQNVSLINEMADPPLIIGTSGTITPTQTATVNISVPSSATPGFYHFSVTGATTVPTFQGGWVVVTKPPATLNKAGDGQTGGSLTLTATLVPGSSGETAQGATILFTTDNGTLSQRLVTTDSSGNATVTLTLPSGAGTAHVTAEGPYGLGHPVVTFTESN